MEDTSANKSTVNHSPILVVDRSGILKSANSGSWILLKHWNIREGEHLPHTWKRSIKTAVDSNQTSFESFSLGYITYYMLLVPDSKNNQVVIYGADVSQRQQMEKELLIKAHVQSQAHEGIVVMDPEFRTLDVNPAYTRITGFSEEDSLGEFAPFMKSAQEDEEEYKKILTSLKNSGTWYGELMNKRKHGQEFPVRISLSAVRFNSDSITHYVAILTDITTQKTIEKQLYNMAHYDGLTGLANRELFIDYTESVINHAKRSKEQFALMIVDLDGFKNINDTFGHKEGDELLKTVAQRMTKALRKSDLVARFGGDEFAILVRDLKETHAVIPIARKVLNAISDTKEIHGFDAFITASIGIALYPQDNTEINALLREADRAMYKTKKRGKAGIHFFSRDMETEAEGMVQIQARLRRAIDSNRIKVYYQPQISTTDGRVVGMEALVRWEGADGKTISPSEFIPIAEESGLINRIGFLVLQTACQQGKHWEDNFDLPLQISVNVSVRQLMQKDFTSKVEKILLETGFPPQRLEIELTESLFIEDEKEVFTILQDLTLRGIRLAIDDFGTHYASLLYIKNFPIHRLKIDKLFIQEIPEDQDSAQIVDAIISMANSLNCEVIAEGVETREQLLFLRDRGCLQFQGFIGSPPVPPEKLETLIQTGLQI